MSRANRAARALIIAEAKAALARLAADGTYVAATAASDSPAAAFSIHAPSKGADQPIGNVSRPAVAYALRKGWLECDPPGQRLCLSKAGVFALETEKRRTPRAATMPKLPRGPQPKPTARPPASTPLALLRRRRHKDGRPLVSDAQLSAAEMLSADFWRGQLSPRVTANWSELAPARRSRRSTPGAGVEMRDRVVAARQRFQRALDAVGPELAGLLVDVSCHDIGLEAAGQARGWPQRAAKVVLDLALTRLARHYGLIAPERPAAARMRHWGEADYKPSIDQWR
jgi:hypothetical protein